MKKEVTKVVETVVQKIVIMAYMILGPVVKIGRAHV
jgi:hypothetical protein